jgi:hypothetical protein
VEHTLKRTERSWIARLVAGSAPELIETETDYLLTVRGSQPAFLVLITPNAAGVADPGRVMHLIGVARRQHRLVFQIGRAIVLAFNGAWGHPALVDNLATLLVRHQLGGPVPTLLPRSRLRSGLRALRAWLHALATPQEPEHAPPPVTGRAPTAAIQGLTGQEAALPRGDDPVVAVMPGQGTDTA